MRYICRIHTRGLDGAGHTQQTHKQHFKGYSLREQQVHISIKKKNQSLHFYLLKAIIGNWFPFYTAYWEVLHLSPINNVKQI